jgi:hypothetical protein
MIRFKTIKKVLGNDPEISYGPQSSLLATRDIARSHPGVGRCYRVLRYGHSLEANSRTKAVASVI